MNDKITYYYLAGKRKRKKILRSESLAKAFEANCLAAGVKFRKAETTFTCKVDSGGQVVSEWESTGRCPMNHTFHIFHNGVTHGFGKSRRSAAEARIRALAALDMLAAA